MVAYSFNTAFVDQIRDGSKRQTIRLPRKRHARPGERLQLFTGMRTRHCRKIVEPDPICVGVDEVSLDLRPLDGLTGPTRPPTWLEDVVLTVKGMPVTGKSADAYAVGDGFPSRIGVDGRPLRRISPFEHMVRWWMFTHGPVFFEGVAIRWTRQP